MRAKGLFVALAAGLLFSLAGPTYTYAAVPEAANKQPHSVLGHGQRMILIDAGHGGIDGGTSYGKVLEKDINLAISRKLFILLRSDGFDAILNRFGDYALSDENRWLRTSSRHLRDLAQRKELADTLPATIVVSIHINWAPSSSNQGPLVLYRQEGRSVMLATAIQDQLNQLYRVKVNPKPGKPFYLLNKITAPTVIVETGFISNPQDRSKLVSRRGQKEIAEAIANGIVAYLMEV